MAQEKMYIYAEAHNGLTVRVPVDRYDEWKKRQEEYKSGKRKADPKVTEEVLRKLKGE